MAFTITAELPLGTYRGASSDGQPEAIPSVSRLYSALLCAAGFGPRAVEVGDKVVPRDADEAALRWVEQNPPDSIAVPRVQVNRGTAIAYRDDGTMKGNKGKGAMTIKRAAKSSDVSVAVDGLFAWTWTTAPPPEIVAALDALCPDVPYLGTSESPVRLTTTHDDVISTHVLDEGAGLFSSAGEDIELPRPGRLTELQNAHELATRKTPSVAQDRIGTDETSSSPVPPREATALVRYSKMVEPTMDIPWSEAIVVPLACDKVPAPARVRAAVSAHRSLVAALGDDVPSLITGSYPPGVSKPANRLALHFVDSDQPFELPTGVSAALVALVPAGASATDVATLTDGLRKMIGLRVAGEFQRLRGDAAQRVSGAAFWREKAAGMVRLWRTIPPAVPETRGDGVGWTFAHAALLSLGFVWQGTAHVPTQLGRGNDRYRALAATANEAGAAVLAASPLRTQAVHDYVHRVNAHAVVRPYRALLSLGALGGDRTVQAIGQSRHLGGGFLVPYDVPEGADLDRELATYAKAGDAS